jgi:hypothetical protein
MRAAALFFIALLSLLLAACGPRISAEQKAQALQAFATVEQVFQHPRCSNCHIPGDQPLQFDSQTPHMMNVVRGPEGKGAPGQPCSTSNCIASRLDTVPSFRPSRSLTVIPSRIQPGSIIAFSSACGAPLSSTTPERGENPFDCE